MRIVGSHLAKFLEDLCLVLRRNPDPGVTDRNLHCTIDFPCINFDPSSLRGELHGVGEQIQKDLLDLALVADEIAKTLVHIYVKCNTVLCGSFPHESACVVDCQGKIERSNLKLHPP